MAIIKKIGFRLILLVIFTFIMNALYQFFFLEADLERNSPTLYSVVKQIKKDSDIIYIGESSNNVSHKLDKDKRNLGELIGAYYPKLITSSLSKNAAHAGVFKHILSNIPNSDKRRTVIVTLNLTSFSYEWIYSISELSMQKECVLISDYPALLNRTILTFKDFEEIPQEKLFENIRQKWREEVFHDLPFEFNHKNVNEWDSVQALKGIIGLNGKRDDELSKLACDYIKTYGFQINFENNPRIKDFNDLINLASDRNWNLVLNLIPENLQKSELLVGKELNFFIRENANNLEKYFKNKGVLVINNIDLLEDNEFVDQAFTTEHYAEKGRKMIARTVAESIKKYHKDSYKETGFKGLLKNYSSPNIDEFFDINYSANKVLYFNDFENDKLWNATNKIINISGNKCGFANKGSKYGPTFFMNPKDLPISKIKAIQIKGELMTEKSDSIKAKIVLEVLGEKGKFYKAINIKRFIFKEDDWNSFKFHLKLPDWTNNSEKIKVYLFNTEEIPVYIDNIEIGFK